MTSHLDVPDDKAHLVSELVQTSRAFSDACVNLRNDPDAVRILRGELERFSTAPLEMLAVTESDLVLVLLPEIIRNLCEGSVSGIGLARNLLRCVPASALERLLLADLASLLDGLVADEVAQLARLLVERGMGRSLDHVVRYLAAMEDPEAADHVRDHQDIEHDPERWRFSVGERIERRQAEIDRDLG